MALDVSIALPLLVVAGLVGPTQPEKAQGPPLERPAAPDYPRRATAEPPLSTLFASDDYPVRPLRRAVEGTVSFRVDVDSRGAITGCTIAATSGDPDLDRATCDIVRHRARFRPALDARGRPVPDTVSARVIWRVEYEPFERYAPESIVTTLTWSDPDPVCSEIVNGQDMGRLSASECLGKFGDVVHAVAETRGSLEVRIVEQFRPGDSAAAEIDTSGLGDQLWLEEVELTIPPGGKVSECRVIRSEQTPFLSLFPMASQCDIDSAQDRAFEPLPEGASHVRRGRSLIAVYARRNQE